jgi:hypothetical protein
MECCTTITVIDMDGPRITLIPIPILSGPIPGMSRSGIRGINKILNTGITLNKSTPIGANTVMVSVMSRIFMKNTIVARAKDGRKDSMAVRVRDPNLRAGERVLVKPHRRDRDLAPLG